MFGSRKREESSGGSARVDQGVLYMDHEASYLRGFFRESETSRSFQPSAAEVVAQSTGSLGGQLHSYLRDKDGRPLAYYLVNLEPDGGRLLELASAPVFSQSVSATNTNTRAGASRTSEHSSPPPVVRSVSRESGRTVSRETDAHQLKTRGRTVLSGADVQLQASSKDQAEAVAQALEKQRAAEVIQMRLDGYLSQPVPPEILRPMGNGKHDDPRMTVDPEEYRPQLLWADVLLHGRGAVGETVLHLCFLLGTPPHRTLATYMVRRFGTILCRQAWDPLIHQHAQLGDKDPRWKLLKKLSKNKKSDPGHPILTTSLSFSTDWAKSRTNLDESNRPTCTTNRDGRSDLLLSTFNGTDQEEATGADFPAGSSHYNSSGENFYELREDGDGIDEKEQSTSGSVAAEKQLAGTSAMLSGDDQANKQAKTNLNRVVNKTRGGTSLLEQHDIEISVGAPRRPEGSTIASVAIEEGSSRTEPLKVGPLPEETSRSGGANPVSINRNNDEEDHLTSSAAAQRVSATRVKVFDGSEEVNHTLFDLDTYCLRSGAMSLPVDAVSRNTHPLSYSELTGAQGPDALLERLDGEEGAGATKATLVKYVDATYTGDSYRGEACIHIAITNGDLAQVKLLVEDGMCDTRWVMTTGSFFRGKLYYGGRPLNFAAAHGNVEIFDFLLEKYTQTAAAAYDEAHQVEEDTREDVVKATDLVLNADRRGRGANLRSDEPDPYKNDRHTAARETKGTESTSGPRVIKAGEGGTAWSQPLASPRGTRSTASTSRLVMRPSPFAGQRSAATGYVGSCSGPSLFHLRVGDRRKLREVEQQRKAFMQQGDQYGNTVLHLMVLHGQLNLLRHVLRTYQHEIELFQLNHIGFAPLNLAAAIQNPAIFDVLMELSGETLWAYGPVRCIRYPLLKLDSVLSRQLRAGYAQAPPQTPDKKPLLKDVVDHHKGEVVEEDAGAAAAPASTPTTTSPTQQLQDDDMHAAAGRSLRSVLEIIVDTKCHSLFTPIVRQLIQDKWQMYGSKVFLLHMTLFFLNLVLVVLATENFVPMDLPAFGILLILALEGGKFVHWSQRNMGPDRHLGCGAASTFMAVRRAADTITFEGCTLILYSLFVLVVYVRVVLGRFDDGAGRVGGGTSSSVSDYDSRWAYDYATEVAWFDPSSVSPRVLLGVASLFGWGHFLHSLRGMQFLGPFVIMIKLMLKKDFARFGIIYVLVAAGFGILLRVMFLDTIRRDRLSWETSHAAFVGAYGNRTFTTHDLDRTMVTTPAPHFSDFSATFLGDYGKVYKNVQIMFRGSFGEMDDEVFSDAENNQYNFFSLLLRDRALQPPDCDDGGHLPPRAHHGERRVPAAANELDPGGGKEYPGAPRRAQRAQKQTTAPCAHGRHSTPERSHAGELRDASRSPHQGGGSLAVHIARRSSVISFL
ncbi:unnamed protein product [Amoebophrya sp. A120]|nr:unnamed protein product [Amoebophrya sp. A120]|eukprot:GSA120T00025245001.1